MKRLPTSALIFLIIFFGFLVYANILGNGFVWDDEEQVVNNPYIKSFQFLPQIFTGSTFQTGGAGLSGWYYKPLMSLWFMFNWQIFGNNAWGFHLTQLLLHLINGILVFLIFEKLFIDYGENRARWTAFFISLIFVIHPANVESVAYISASQEILYTFFLLLSFMVLKIFGEGWHEAKALPDSAQQSEHRWGSSKRQELSLIFLSTFLFFLALLSKESAIIGLPVSFLYFWLIRKEKGKAVWVSFVLFLALWVYFLMRTFIAHVPLSSPHLSPIAIAEFWQRLLTIPFEIFSYLRLIFFPLNLSVAQHQVIKSAADIRFWGILPVVLILLFTLLRLLRKLKNELWKLIFCWFVISLGLVLNIFPLDMTVAERWLYFPMIGMLGMLGVLVSECLVLRPLRWRRWFWVLVIAGGLLAARTFIRTFDWRNGLTLYGHDIKLNSEAFDLQNNYGVELFRANRIDEARPHFEKSIELKPEWWTSYSNLGVIYQREGELEKAKELYRQSIANGDYYLAYENLAGLMLQTEKPEAALDFVNSALQKLPLNQNLRTILVLIYVRQKNYEQALLEAQKLYRLNPTSQNRQFLEAVLKKEKI